MIQTHDPFICPHCKKPLERIDWNTIAEGAVSLVACSRCRKVIGTTVHKPQTATAAPPPQLHRQEQSTGDVFCMKCRMNRAILHILANNSMTGEQRVVSLCQICLVQSANPLEP